MQSYPSLMVVSKWLQSIFSLMIWKPEKNNETFWGIFCRGRNHSQCLDLGSIPRLLMVDDMGEEGIKI